MKSLSARNGQSLFKYEMSWRADITSMPAKSLAFAFLGTRQCDSRSPRAARLDMFIARDARKTNGFGRWIVTLKISSHTRRGKVGLSLSKAHMYHYWTPWHARVSTVVSSHEDSGVTFEMERMPLSRTDSVFSFMHADNCDRAGRLLSSRLGVPEIV